MMIQAYMRGYVVRKQKKRQNRKVNEADALASLIKILAETSSNEMEKYHQAASKIQLALYIRKIKEKKAGRALREELRKLPSVVRAGFMKMQALKAKTSSL